MVVIEKLKEIGLANSEAKIYVTLLKLGEATVAEISQHSGLHRTNVYDSLEKLKEKGLVSYLSKENKQFFRAADPKTIKSYLKEKEVLIETIIPELEAIKGKVEEKITVEIFKGEKGIKSVLKDIILKKQEVYGYTIIEQLRKYLPKFAEYYFREQTKYKIKHKFIYIRGTAKPPSLYYEIRYLPKEFTTTTINISYDDIILNLIWEPEMIAIRIKSKQLAEAFKRHFQLLWEIAKK